MKASKKTIAAVVVSLVAVLALGMFAAGCGSGNDAKVTHTDDATQTEGTSVMAEYAEQFPLEYNSSQMTRVNAKGFTIGHDVGTLRDICERPVMRDVNGDIEWNEDGTMSVFTSEYDPESGQYIVPDLTDEQLQQLNLKSGCVSCKSSKFNDIYAAQGPAAYGNVYNAEARAIVNDEYWDCAMCHDGTPSADNVSPQLVYFQALGEGLADQLEPKMAVCAQCHNSYDYRSRIQTEEDLATFKPYRYGNDVDAVFQSAYEDGVNFYENDLGLPESYVVHPNVEGYMTTNHFKMGVTCVDCHMPMTTDEETGTEYRSHFSASSPLESEDALNYCLTCHEAQGIADTDAMVEFVKGKQATLAADIDTLKADIDAYGEAASAAINGGSMSDADVEQVKMDYAKATWYYQILITGPYESVGSQIAMLDTADILAKAHAAIDEGTALI